ncbi:probable fructose-2,6-bisphosphatase TIGAR A [Astyanax mexicanus]|uniref:fructose-2,6-bisphosphate 2-phosphatase n=2 Tax=Astyanax mexicanus TaxID=7994 RepID=A0A8B9J455_ASTMX|nr:probable fructose-2,6-bisphosphatase TIGAR A [Astyanax mexicanus]KAG9271955.1 fructose-2,6-bisphosphatase TIGAR [Astyanax mexicanus]
MLSFGLTIVRHGETQYNKDGLLQGQGIDSSLSEAGIQQAEAVGLYLEDVHFTNVFASDMKRAKQTAEIIVRKNKTGNGLEIVTDPSLKERSFGIAEGGRVEDMRNMAKAAGQLIPEFTPPKGETMDQVKVRISMFLKAMFQRMADDHRDKVRPDVENQPDVETAGPLAGLPNDGVQDVPVHALVVTHGAYMRVAVRYFIEDLACSVPPGSDMSQVFSACSNTGICRFIVTLRCCNDDVTLLRMKCIFINRRDHLKAEDS